jgi:hypothetical protein
MPSSSFRSDLRHLCINSLESALERPSVHLALQRSSRTYSRMKAAIPFTKYLFSMFNINHTLAGSSRLFSTCDHEQNNKMCGMKGP